MLDGRKVKTALWRLYAQQTEPIRILHGGWVGLNFDLDGAEYLIGTGIRIPDCPVRTELPPTTLFQPTEMCMSF